MILDCDLLIGRDIVFGRSVAADELGARLTEAGIAGGAVASLRALLFHAPSGNDEAHVAAVAHHWLPVAGVDLRDALGAELEIERAAELGIRLIRFASTRQGISGSAPRIRLLARAAAERGLTLLVEGSPPEVAGSFMDLGASVLFLDLHFYDLGEFVLLARQEPGFHTSTRLLGGPDAWETVAGEVGAERLVFGTRAGWFEEESVLYRLGTARLDEADLQLVKAGNLQRLAGVGA